MDCVRSSLVLSLTVLLCTLGAESQSLGRCAQKTQSTGANALQPGAFRPQCTEKGHYQLIQRHGSTGYSWCVNPITGVKVKTTEVGPGEEPSCTACVTQLASALEQQTIGQFRPYCNKNGSFRRKQLDGSTGFAWCVDSVTGDKLTTPERNSNKLRCSATAAAPTRRKRQTLGPCAQELANTVDIPSAPGSFKPQCTEKGNYQLIQKHTSTGYTWCVNPLTGAKIASTETAPGQDAPQCPTCIVLLAKCSNARSMLGPYRPQCDATTGLFNPIQINASTNYAWCADVYTGRKLGESQRYDSTMSCDVTAYNEFSK